MILYKSIGLFKHGNVAASMKSLNDIAHQPGYYTARSGKPAAFLEDGPTEFGSEAEVRRIMNAESEEEARRRDAGNPSRKEERKRGVEDITNKISNMINMKLELKQK